MSNQKYTKYIRKNDRIGYIRNSQKDPQKLMIAVVDTQVWESIRVSLELLKIAVGVSYNISHLESKDFLLICFRAL